MDGELNQESINESTGLQGQNRQEASTMQIPLSSNNQSQSQLRVSEAASDIHDNWPPTPLHVEPPNWQQPLYGSVQDLDNETQQQTEQWQTEQWQQNQWDAGNGKPTSPRVNFQLGGSKPSSSWSIGFGQARALSPWQMQWRQRMTNINMNAVPSMRPTNFASQPFSQAQFSQLYPRQTLATAQMQQNNGLSFSSLQDQSAAMQQMQYQQNLGMPLSGDAQNLYNQEQLPQTEEQLWQYQALQMLLQEEKGKRRYQEWKKALMKLKKRKHKKKQEKEATDNDRQYFSYIDWKGDVVVNAGNYGVQWSNLEVFMERLENDRKRRIVISHRQRRALLDLFDGDKDKYGRVSKKKLLQIQKKLPSAADLRQFRQKALQKAEAQNKKNQSIQSDSEHNRLLTLHHHQKKQAPALTAKEREKEYELEKKHAERRVVDRWVQYIDDNGFTYLDYRLFLDNFTQPRENCCRRYRLWFKMSAVFAFYAMAPLFYCTFGDLDNPDAVCYKLDIPQTLYFASATLTTVGFGDATPHTNCTKIFTVFYVLIGLILLGDAFSDVFDRFLETFEKRLQKKEWEARQRRLDEMQHKALRRRQKAFDSSQNLGMFGRRGGGLNISDDQLTIGQKNRKVVAKNCFERCLFGETLADQKLSWLKYKRWAQIAATIVTPIVLGGFVVGHLERWDFVNSFYWATLTVTTVGYGDLPLESTWSHYFCTIFLPFSVVAVSFAIGNIAQMRMELNAKKKEFDFESKTLTPELLSEMDSDGNGVDQFEFVVGTLLALEKVTREDIEPILVKFHQLDTDGSGLLTKEDLINYEQIGMRVDDDDEEDEHQD